MTYEIINYIDHNLNEQEVEVEITYYEPPIKGVYYGHPDNWEQSAPAYIEFNLVDKSLEYLLDNERFMAQAYEQLTAIPDDETYYY